MHCFIVHSYEHGKLPNSESNHWSIHYSTIYNEWQPSSPGSPARVSPSSTWRTEFEFGTFCMLYYWASSFHQFSHISTQQNTGQVQKQILVTPSHTYGCSVLYSASRSIKAYVSGCKCLSLWNIQGYLHVFIVHPPLMEYGHITSLDHVFLSECR